MSLAGRGVLVTRPRELAQGLAALVAGAGGRPILFPAIEIEPLAPQGPAGRFDMVVFVSPTAVEQGRRWIGAGEKTFAVGAGTAERLKKHVQHVIFPASGADSEALLALPELAQLRGQRVLIVRGEGGRALLGEALAARGARVEFVECYRRTRPAADRSPVLDAWAGGQLHAITVNSIEALENLAAMLGAAGGRCLREAPLFVPHPRVAGHAERMAIRKVVLAGPSDDEMIERLVAYFSHER